MRTARQIFIIFLALIFLLGCKANKSTKGGAIGAGAGGAIGGIIGKQSGNTAAGVIIGATVGGAAGALIGRYMDKQAEELKRDLENARVERVGEGIKITFNSGILFDVNSAELRSEAKENIQELAKTLKKYDDTNVLIDGHTDNTGSDDYNKSLSEKRAAAVSSYARQSGVAGGRIEVRGFGEEQPIASNETSEGKQQNRRVEIAIFANEKLKKAAEKGDVKID